MDKKILIIGKNSKIARHFIKKIPNKSDIYAPSKKEWNMENIKFNQKKIKIISQVDKILLLQSIISSKNYLKRSTESIVKQIKINLLSILSICEIALNNNKKIKIIVIGSESGIKGSNDLIYALTKNSLHKYIEERKIKYPEQQLLCVAPSTIIDGNITLNRRDKKNVSKSILNNPKKRGILSSEISNLIYSLFYEQTDYLNNLVIRVDGGKFSRMEINK